MRFRSRLDVQEGVGEFGLNELEGGDFTFDDFTKDAQRGHYRQRVTTGFGGARIWPHDRNRNARQLEFMKSCANLGCKSLQSATLPEVDAANFA